MGELAEGHTGILCSPMLATFLCLKFGQNFKNLKRFLKHSDWRQRTSLSRTSGWSTWSGEDPGLSLCCPLTTCTTTTGRKKKKNLKKKESNSCLGTWHASSRSIGRSWIRWPSCVLCCAQSLQARLTLCDPMDHGLPGSSAHGTFLARILKQVSMPSSRRSSWSKDQTCLSCISCTAGEFFTAESLEKP